MKLLIVTQVVDKTHPILGFFHRWIEEFASHCERVEVVCLLAGKHSLPANVHVHSLGKEDGAGRVVYLWRLYKYSWQLRTQYDGVFVHMVPIYAVLGAPLWRFILRKKVGLWYVHGAVEWPLRVAEKLVQVIFTAAPEGFNIKTKKVIYTGHGIDTNHFKPDSVAVKNLDLISVGRIAPSKNITSMIDVLALVRQSHDVTLSIFGNVASGAYEDNVRTKINDLHLTKHVQFPGTISQEELPAALNSAKIFVTTAQNGSLDKVVLEAMSCGLPVVSMAPGTASLPLERAQTDNIKSTAEEISAEISSAEHKNYRQYIEEHHSLKRLIPGILSQYE